MIGKLPNFNIGYIKSADLTTKEIINIVTNLEKKIKKKYRFDFKKKFV